jgi:hypothetical protein
MEERLNKRREKKQREGGEGKE